MRFGPQRSAGQQEPWRRTLYRAGENRGEVPREGVSLLGELYDLTPEQYETLLSGEPPDMYEQSIELEDGSHARAMLYRRELIENHGYPDISHYGGWAAYKHA